MSAAAVGTVHDDARAVRVLWRREFLRFARNPVRVVVGLLTPLMFLLVLGTGLTSAVARPGADYRSYLFPGMLVMAVQAPAITTGVTIMWDRRAGFLREMLVAPVRRGALIAGTCVGGATTALASGAALLALAGVAGIAYRPAALAGALLALAVTALAFTSLGALAAVSIRRMETFQVVSGLAMMPLLFLSGAMFPVAGLPGWLRGPVLLNPLTYAVDAVRRLLGAAGGGDGPTWFGSAPPVALEIGMTAGLAALAMWAAARRFARVD